MPFEQRSTYGGSACNDHLTYNEEPSGDPVYGTSPNHEYGSDPKIRTPRTCTSSKNSNEQALTGPCDCDKTAEVDTNGATMAMTAASLKDKLDFDYADGAGAQEENLEVYNALGYESNVKEQAAVGVEQKYEMDSHESQMYNQSSQQMAWPTEGIEYDNQSHGYGEGQHFVSHSAQQKGESSNTAAGYSYRGAAFRPPAKAPKGPRTADFKQFDINPDYKFRKHHSNLFRPGAVFKTIWPEPVGATSDVTTLIPAKQKGKAVHVSTRRFIIVWNADNQSYCIPIFTYGKKGLCKKGANPKRHGIAYAGDEVPELLRGEPALGYEPVRVNMKADEILLKESRVNYSNLSTLQHNIKVNFIGEISDHELEHIVRPAVYQIIEEGKHNKQPRERRKEK